MTPANCVSVSQHLHAVRAKFQRGMLIKRLQAP
jgi:hypothetical protein